MTRPALCQHLPPLPRPLLSNRAPFPDWWGAAPPLPTLPPRPWPRPPAAKERGSLDRSSSGPWLEAGSGRWSMAVTQRLADGRKSPPLSSTMLPRLLDSRPKSSRPLTSSEHLVSTIQGPLTIWTYHSFFCKYNLGPSLKIKYQENGWEYQRASFIGLKFGISRITRLWFQVFKWLHL